jgi:TatD DNase family protein
MLIDTHSHLNFSAYKDDAGDVIKRTLEDGIWMINVGSQYSTSKRAVEIAERYEKGVYAAVGLHPIHLSGGIFKTKIDKEEVEFETREEEFDRGKYRELARSEKVVAVGEIGLDYWYRPKTKTKLEQFKRKQKEVFLSQMKLAGEIDLPVIFHCRLAHEDLIAALGDEEKGVVHCFSGSWQEAQKYLSKGLYLGFNGIIFKLDLDEVIEKTPLDRILVETDCPYLTPPPKEGRNEPLYVKYVAEKIAKIKKLSYQEITAATTQNAIKLFNLHG